MANKSEKATPKKLKDARKKGQVAKSQDVPAAFTFAVSILGTLALGSYLFSWLASFIVQMFGMIGTPDTNLEDRIGGIVYSAIETIAMASFPIVLTVAFVGVLVNFLVIGPVFSMEAMKFDLKKLNPVEGIKNKFKMKTLFELAKSLFKISGAAVIIFLVIWSRIPQVVQTAGIPILSSAALLEDFLSTIAIRVAIFFFAVAVIDLAFQKKTFASEMKMEKFEVRQEFKDTEGDPLIKGKRKQIAQEMAYQEGPQAAMRAKAIITNPIHIAVAIKYNEEADPAPLILAMGIGPMADKIIKIGQENHIPIMRNVDLAQNLHNNGRVNGYVPEDTYKAIAEILKWIDALEENPEYNVELFKE